MPLPTWYTAITPGQWGTLPNSILTGSGVDEPNVYELILAWGGAWQNTYGVYIGTTFVPGTFLMLGPSGGHTDSGLNSVYAYGPLEADAPTWHRVRSATSPAPGVIAQFTGSISGTTLTVSATQNGAIVAGSALIGSGVVAGTTIVSGSGTTWTVSASQTVASTQMYEVAGNVTLASLPVDSNGNPLARHSYAGLAYLGDTVKKLLACGNFRYSDAGVPGQSLFDLSISNPDGAGVQPWSQPAQAAASTSNALHDDIQIAQYDSANNRVWVWSPSGGGNGNDVGYYDVATNTWHAAGFKSPLVNNGSNTSSCIDTTRGLWMMWAKGTLQFFQTNNGTANDFYPPTTTGTAPTIGTTAGSGIVGNGSMLYDQIDDQLVVWYNAGQALAALKPPATSPYKGGNAWTWSSIATGGATPGPENGTAPAASGFPAEPASDGSCHGTYGRFALYNNATTQARGYLLLNRTSEAIYFYRPASAVGPAPTGTAAITEGADTVAGSGSIAVSGSAAISEAADVASGTGALGTSGAAAIAEGADTASGSGTAISGAAGSAAITEGADTVSGTGALAVSGAAAVHEGADAVSGSGNIAIGGSAAIAEGSDIAVGSGFIGSGIPMPNLIGVNYFEALQILQDAGIYIPLPAYAFAPPTVNVTWQKSALRGGIVTAQSLPAGAGAFAGEVITLTVSAFPFAAVIDAATGSQRVN